MKVVELTIYNDLSLEQRTARKHLTRSYSDTNRRWKINEIVRMRNYAKLKELSKEQSFVTEYCSNIKLIALQFLQKKFLKARTVNAHLKKEIGRNK